MRGTTITLGLITVSLGAAALATGYGAHLDLLGLTAGTVGLVGSVLLVLALLPARDLPVDAATDGAATPTDRTTVEMGQPRPDTP